jgi:hypothetical protein
MTYAAKRNLVDELLEEFKSAEVGNDFLHWVYDRLDDVMAAHLQEGAIVEAMRITGPFDASTVSAPIRAVGGQATAMIPVASRRLCRPKPNGPIV